MGFMRKRYENSRFSSHKVNFPEKQSFLLARPLRELGIWATRRHDGQFEGPETERSGAFTSCRGSNQGNEYARCIDGPADHGFRGRDCVRAKFARRF